MQAIGGCHSDSEPEPSHAAGNDNGMQCANDDPLQEQDATQDEIAPVGCPEQHNPGSAEAYEMEVLLNGLKPTSPVKGCFRSSKPVSDRLMIVSMQQGLIHADHLCTCMLLPCW